jgi:hypothetical protein
VKLFRGFVDEQVAGLVFVDVVRFAAVAKLANEVVPLCGANLSNSSL